MFYNINEDMSNNIIIHNISRPYPINVNITNPDYFDELCKKIFTIWYKEYSLIDIKRLFYIYQWIL